MNNRLMIISDIHINDYPNRNPSNRYRLYQSDIVSDNIVEVGKKNNANIIVIAGDLIEKSILRPYVQAEAKKFLDKLSRNFKYGFIIWGNHDQDNKGSDQEFIDSCLSVMLPSNFYYADKREITLDNTRIAFSNWRPEFDLSWISTPVDLLITHATISYSNQDMVKSQVLDESKFNLAICGDIHKPAQIGKYVSIGIPQKCKMGDSDNCTGIIFDCMTKNWKWVNLNPNDNLMKFVYTTEKTEEGWDEKTKTWKVYKPASLGNKNGLIDVQIPEWKKIEELVNNIIINNNLIDVHSEVLKNINNIESKEVDFNFQLTRLYCKNWRSIDEVELFFEYGDKILITGSNGSGKSSLLSALKYAFTENRYIKDFIQIGTKECLAEVNFLYQGSEYILCRGSKKYGLAINGVPQKYNNKREFEEDVRTRFPFIDYMDVYFFDPSHHELLGSLTPERKSEIISKFFRMDKIDALHEQAESMLDTLTKSSNVWKESISKSKELLNYIEGKLSEIVLPKATLHELLESKRNGLELQDKYRKWNEYKLQITSINSKINTYKETIKSIKEKQSNLPPIDQVKDKINSNVSSINKIEEEIRLLNRESLEEIYNTKKAERLQILDRGNKLNEEWKNIGINKICSKCGQVIKTSEALNNHKAELEKELYSLQDKKRVLEEELSKLYTDINEIKAKESNLVNISDNLKKENSNLETSIVLFNNYENYIIETNNNIIELENNLKSTQAPDEVSLPENFFSIMESIEKDINNWEKYNSLTRDKESALNNINNCNKELELLDRQLNDLQRYIKITGPTGKVNEEIMTKLSEQFSDNSVKYEINTYKFRNKDYLDLTSSYNNNGNWINYQSCSSGQRTVLDINFLSKIVTKLGILVLDEFFKHLDPANHEICIDLIKSMNIGCIMLSSHMESLASFNNKSCQLSLNNSGITQITLK